MANSERFLLSFPCHLLFFSNCADTVSVIYDIFLLAQTTNTPTNPCQSTAHLPCF